LALLVGTKLQHVVSLLALEIVAPRGPTVAGTQVKPRDELFWFGKPEILIRLIQFISFQNAFEMATFVWCVIGSKVKKALIAESVWDSLHNWCKRVKERSKTLSSVATRSTCSLESTIDEGDEEITVASGTLSQSSSTGTLNHMDDDNQDSGPLPQQELSLRMSEYLSDTMRHVLTNRDIEEDEESKVQPLEDLFQKT
nr:MLO-like protein 4 [Tanacetum cinerariifolium]